MSFFPPTGMAGITTLGRSLRLHYAQRLGHCPTVGYNSEKLKKPTVGQDEIIFDVRFSRNAFYGYNDLENQYEFHPVFRRRPTSTPTQPSRDVHRNPSVRRLSPRLCASVSEVWEVVLVSLSALNKCSSTAERECRVRLAAQ